MHELSLAEDMLALIQTQAQQQGFDRVASVLLEVGKLSHVEAEAMSFCFDAVMAGTLAEGARLDIERTKGLGKCKQCNAVSPIEQLYDPCEQCGGFDIEIIQGDQVRIKSLEVL